MIEKGKVQTEMMIKSRKRPKRLLDQMNDEGSNRRKKKIHVTSGYLR